MGFLEDPPRAWEQFVIGTEDKGSGKTGDADRRCQMVSERYFLFTN